MRFLNTVMPLKDETILSFVRRLLNRNAIDDINDFFSIDDTTGNRALFSWSGNEFFGDTSGYKDNFDIIRNSLPEDHPVNKDIVGFYLNHSLLPIYSMFFKKEEKGLSDSVNRTERPVCFCKECYEEDKAEYGNPIIHRTHQMEGVYVCPKHNTPLMYSRGTDLSFKNMTVIEGYHNADPSLAYQYSVMCRDLLENQIASTAEDIEKTIDNVMKALPPVLYSYDSSMEFSNPKYKELYLDRERKEYLIHAAQDTGLLEGVNGYNKKAYYRGGGRESAVTYFFRRYNVSANLGLVMLFILFRTASFACEIISKKGRVSEEDKARIAVNLLTDDYSIEKVQKESYNTYISLTHKLCGKTTRYSARKFLNGDRCPYCEVEIPLKELLSRETDWIVKQRDAKAYLVRGTRIVCIPIKGILQEINRPFLSPVIELTRKERDQAHAEYRAKEIIQKDNESITSALEEVEIISIHKALHKLYPNEEYFTVKALSEHYTRYLSGIRFFIA